MTPKPENTTSYNLEKEPSSAYVNNGYVNNEKAVIPHLEMNGDIKLQPAAQATQQRVIDFDVRLQRGFFPNKILIYLFSLENSIGSFASHWRIRSISKNSLLAYDSLRILCCLRLFFTNLHHTRA